MTDAPIRVRNCASPTNVFVLRRITAKSDGASLTISQGQGAFFLARHACIISRVISRKQTRGHFIPGALAKRSRLVEIFVSEILIVFVSSSFWRYLFNPFVKIDSTYSCLRVAASVCFVFIFSFFGLLYRIYILFL